MKLVNAVKKIEKATGKEIEVVNSKYIGDFGRYVVEFFCNCRFNLNADIVCIGVRLKNDYSDSMTDYCASIFCNNISQAIKLATN